MKNVLYLAVLFGVAAVAAYAGSLADPLMEGVPEVAESGVTDRDWIVPLILLGVVAIAVASSDGGGGGYDY